MLSTPDLSHFQSPQAATYEVDESKVLVCVNSLESVPVMSEQQRALDAAYQNKTSVARDSQSQHPQRFAAGLSSFQRFLRIRE